MDVAARPWIRRLFALALALGSACANAETPVYRCIAQDHTVSYQELPCPEEKAELELALDEMGFGEPMPDTTEPEPVAQPVAAPPAPPPPDPGADLVTWEELECHAVGYYGVQRRYPFHRSNAGASCHTVTRTATRRDRCRQLDAYHEEFRASTITWRERREELIAAKNQMAAVDCCVGYSDTSLGNARAQACVGPKAFTW